MGVCRLIAILLLLPSVGMAAPSPAAVAGDPDLHLSWRMNVSQLLPAWIDAAGVEGVAEVALSVIVDEDGVHRLLRVAVPELFLSGTAAGSLTAELWVPPGAPAALQARLAGAAGALTLQASLELVLDLATGRVAWVPGPLGARLETTAFEIGEVCAAVFGIPVEGRLSGALQIAGDSRAPELDLQARIDETAWRGVPLGILEARIQHGSGRTRIDSRLGESDDPVAILEAELPLDLDLHGPTVTWRDGEEHRVSLTAGVVGPDTLRPLWAAPEGVDFHLGFNLEGRGTLAHHRVVASLEGMVEVDGDRLDVAAVLESGPDLQHLDIVLGDEEVVLDLVTEIPMVAARAGTARLADAPLRGRLRAKLPAGRFLPFLGPGVGAATGVFSAGLEVTGTLGSPDLQGTLALDRAAFSVLPIGRRLEGITARAVVHGTRLELKELVALAAPGEIRGEGVFDLVATPDYAPADASLWSDWSIDGRLALRLQELPLVREGWPVALVSGDVSLGLALEPGARWVAVKVKQGHVLLTDDALPEVRAIPTNPSVRRVTPGAGPGAAEPAYRGARWHLVLELSDRVTVRGPAVDMELDGTLRVDRTGPRVHVEGGLDVVPGGRFELFENPFELRAGRLTLAEGHLGRETGPREASPMEPILDIVARGKVQRTHVLVRVSGPAQRPALVLLSSPALPEFQIMTLLILGRVDVVDDRNGEVRRQIAKIVERYESPDLKRQLFDSIGVDNLGVGFGKSAANPILTVGKQVTRELYVETVYHHNAPPDENSKEARVEYRWTPHWTTDTAFGDRAEGRLGVSWGTLFGGRPPPEAPAEAWGLLERSGPPPDRDGDGITDAFDLCGEIREDLDGDRDEDGCPEPDPPPRMAPGWTLVGGALRSISFDPSSASLPGDAALSLQRLAGFFEDLPRVTVTVVGHSDDLGTPESKREISLRRAESARDALLRAGLPAHADVALHVAGDSRPLDPEDSARARALNRRVEIRLAPAPVNE
jgi:outer membrane protein OmpA-like peptidoglycan-associated protein